MQETPDLFYPEMANLSLSALTINPVILMKKRELNNAGGFVSMDRVEGNLNLSRALGDFSYKANKDLPSVEQMVLNFPEIHTETIDKNTEFLIIACDGIWDCMTNQEAVDFINFTSSKLK